MPCLGVAHVTPIIDQWRAMAGPAFLALLFFSSAFCLAGIGGFYAYIVVVGPQPPDPGNVFGALTACLRAVWRVGA